MASTFAQFSGREGPVAEKASVSAGVYWGLRTGCGIGFADEEAIETVELAVPHYARDGVG